MGLGIAMVATALYMMMSRIAPAPPPTARVSETFRLQCLSPEQAAEVLRPHIQATGLISFQPNSSLGVIKVEASREEMVTARSVLDRYDSPAESQCSVQVTVPRVP
jgi:type II secretory pathway component GspD/PulD (secretin)